MVTSAAFAQTITPQVIATAGNHSTITGMQVSWTIGETITSTISNGNNTITQGFHQPDTVIVISLEEKSESGILVNVFPNPTSDIISINLTNNLKNLQLELFDMTGKLLQAREIGTFENHIQINMVDYANANYLLRIHSIDDDTNYNYKLIKQ